jgi:parallel beta-helix repeat protein
MVVYFAVLTCVVAGLAIAGELLLSQTGAAETGGFFSGYGVPGVSGNTIVVDPNTGYGSIDRALREASEGDTILVHSGTYAGCLVVGKRVILKGVDTGGGQPEINARSGGDAVTLASKGIWMEGFVVKNAASASSGILVRADNCTVTGNEVTGCFDGIRVDGARNVVVAGNHPYGNGDSGIFVTASSGIRVAGNHANDNHYGAYMEKSTDSVIEDNNCSNNIDIDLYLENISDSLVRGNTITSERIKDKKIDGLGMRYGTNVTFDGNYVSRHYYGIKVYNSQDCLVENNVADGSGVNIRLDFETHATTLRNNTVRNGVDNIYLHSTAYGNLVENNTCYNGREGIYMLESAGNLVRGNEVFNNSIGIRMVSTTANTVTGNYAYGNVESIDSDGGNNTVYENYDYPKPGKPAPTGAPTAMPTPVPASPGGNSILDFISSIIRMIFH